MVNQDQDNIYSPITQPRAQVSNTGPRPDYMTWSMQNPGKTLEDYNSNFFSAGGNNTTYNPNNYGDSGSQFSAWEQAGRPVTDSTGRSIDNRGAAMSSSNPFASMLQTRGLLRNTAPMSTSPISNPTGNGYNVSTGNDNNNSIFGGGNTFPQNSMMGMNNQDGIQRLFQLLQMMGYRG